MAGRLLGRLARLSLALAIAFLVGGFASQMSAAAQEEPVCESPGLLGEATPEAVDDMAATPEAMEEEMMASPEAMAEGESADPAVAAQVIAAIENYAACFNDGQTTGDPGLYIALESDDYIASQTESGEADVIERVQDESEGPQVTAEILGIDNVLVHPDGRLSADVSVIFNDTAYADERIFLSRDDSLQWKWDEEQYLSPDPDVGALAVVGGTIGEIVDEETGESEPGITLNLESHPAIEGLALHLTNATESAVEAVLFAVPEGTTIDQIFSGEVAPEIAGFTAGLLPGESRNLMTLNLPPGSYLLVTFGDEGALAAEFTVTEPEEL